MEQNSSLSVPDSYLTIVEKQAGELIQKLAKKDSTKAAQLLATSTQNYQQLAQTLQGEKSLQEYIPSLDTLVSFLKFLSQNQERLSTTKAVQEKLTCTLNKAKAVNQLNDLPFIKEFKKLQKQAYYYQAQVQEYKILELLSQTKAFQSFMRKNSQLASLFRIPGGKEDQGLISLTGSQTQKPVNAGLQQRFGSDSNTIAQLRENVQAATERMYYRL